MLKTQELSVAVRHYVDDDIWVATSDDITGMIVESQGIAAFLIDVTDVAVQLLELNDGYDADSITKTSLRLRIDHILCENSKNLNLKQPSLRLTELQLAAV